MAHNIPPPNNISVVPALDPPVQTFIQEVDEDVAFWVGNFDHPRESLNLFKTYLPKIRICYAMKCCNEMHLLKWLIKEGTGFDCASIHEMEKILGLGGDPNKMVFTHPLKPIRTLKYAKEKGIKRLVYDTEEELEKIMKIYPEAEVFLRVKPKFTNAKIPLSNKFGATPKGVHSLIQATKRLNAHFIGFSFHVGSLCDSQTTFKQALEYAAELKKEAEEAGLKVNFIDIGGGFFPPSSKTQFTFAQIAQAINEGIDEYFPEKDVDFIAEPGRFIGSEYMDLYCPVICAKDVEHKDGTISQSIFIPDGMYGAFNAIIWDHAQPHFELYRKNGTVNMDEKIQTTLWGQTCDSMDVIYENMQWPKLQLGDMLIIRKFSAYTYAPESFFNGFHHHRVFTLNADDKPSQ